MAYEHRSYRWIFTGLYRPADIRNATALSIFAPSGIHRGSKNGTDQPNSDGLFDPSGFLRGRNSRIDHPAVIDP